MRPSMVKILISGLIGAALAAGYGSNAQAQLAKQGTYSAWIGFSSTAKTIAVSENHVFNIGEFTGTSHNGSGGGFLHNMAWYCTGMLEVVGGKADGQGYCTVTDADGDKVAGKWVCSGMLPDCTGIQKLDEGGTGKFAGIKAENKFDFAFVGSTGHAISVVYDGRYRID